VFWRLLLELALCSQDRTHRRAATQSKSWLPNAWAQASVKGDVAGMARLMSDDYVEIVMETATGTSKSSWLTISKTEWVHLVQSGREKYTSVDLRNLKVNLHGDVATVSGGYSQTGTKDGKDIGSSGLYVDTWVKKNGKWQVVSSVFP
jgi:ketosteroid isomerase-like protein